MFVRIHENPDIYSVPVVLPNNPLKNLNCYVVKTPEGNLVIDTGFNMPECLAALTEGLRELDIDMDRTTLFLTHLHSDHVGLVGHIATPGTRVLMGRKDYDMLASSLAPQHWEWMERRFYREGLSKEQLELQRTVNPARRFAPERIFPAQTVEDGDRFTIGGYEFSCIWTPGHTPGHMCLYLDREGILFAGDHILFDITPNITMWRGTEDSLGDYLQSLQKIRALDLRLTLPAHRKNDMDVYERIRQIEQHHDRRIAQALSIVREHPGINACGIGAQMSWKMRGKNWEEFPIQQKWFAIGETIAHLDYLIRRGKVIRHDEDEMISYTAAE